ncbi:outer membrane beta-barrel protein [Emticicia sp. SJ17W-69]|uniref:outer membrane beta-barrel protein n=1 Tax=Emticicia sp. SJ17W-69 TaxID=3421657 RepID=UPI003EC0AF68
MKKLQKITLFLLYGFMCHAQAPNGKITGKIVDENQKVVEFANIMLHRSADSVFVKAALCNEFGLFEFENISNGSYFLKISHTNFEKYASPKFIISDETPVLDFKEIALKTSIKNLGEVSVKAAKPFIERQLDKIVVNVENSIVATGNSVLEVLERSPGIVVNQESSINLKGKAGIVLMIDGKPSPLSGTDLITYLKGIPAANIQSIEIITNPSARYDAAGNAGIINIKFKKDKNEGLNGSFTLSYGQGEYWKPSASVNFNYRKKKWNIFGSHSHAQPTQLTRFYINRKFFDESKNLISTFDQTSFTKQPISSDNSRFGVDYYLNKKTIIGVMANTNWVKVERNGTTNAFITKSTGQLDYTNENFILSNDKRFNGFANFNFKHTFDSTGKELTADIDFGKYNSKTIQDISNQNFSPSGQPIFTNKLATNQTGTISVKSFKADYVHPFSKTTKLEMGLKSSLVTSDNDVKFFDVINNQNKLDPSRSNNFIYKENVNAAYASFAKQLKKWDFQTGLRIEQTHTNGVQLTTGEKFERKYINFFPNVVLNKKFSENNQLSLSYSKRIDRPSYRQLNPFRIFVDSYTYVVGDPKLKPVITNLYELNHTFKGKYVTTLSYNKSKQSITDIFVQEDDTKISYQIPANLQDFEQLNLGLYIPFSIKNRVNSTFTGSANWNKYTSPLQGGTLENQYKSWDARLSNNIILGKGWTAELTGFYQSKSVWGLFIIKSLAQVSMGIQKVSKDKLSTFKFGLTDMFLTNHIAVIVKYQNMDFFTDRTWDSRVATISYSYRFGKNTVARARQRNTGVEDEKRRAN